MNRKQTVFLAVTLFAVMLLPSMAFAEGMHIAPESQGFVALGAGLAIGLAAMGCGLAQGIAAFAALQGIARNPSAAGKIQTPMIIGLALIESLCIYALVIGFLLQAKL